MTSSLVTIIVFLAIGYWLIKWRERKDQADFEKEMDEYLRNKEAQAKAEAKAEAKVAAVKAENEQFLRSMTERMNHPYIEHTPATAAATVVAAAAIPAVTSKPKKKDDDDDYNKRSTSYDYTGLSSFDSSSFSSGGGDFGGGGSSGSW